MGMFMSCLSNIMYLSEKVALYATCVGLISCLMLTFVSTLGMGIGLGYNYCYVDLKTRHKYVPGHYIYHGSPRWPKLRKEDAPFDPRDVSIEDELRKRITPSEEPIHQPHEFPGPDRPIEAKSTPDDDDDITRPMVYLTTSTKDDNDTMAIEEYSNVALKSIETTTSDSTADSVDITNDVEEDTNEPTSTPTSDINDSNSRRVKKLVIPISGLDLISLLSKLKAENKNYSLQIVTT